MLIAAIAMLQTTATISSDFVRYTVSLNAGEYVEQIEAKDNAGKWRIIATSPTHPLVKANRASGDTQALIVDGSSPYDTLPTLRFTTMSNNNNTVELHAEHGNHKLGKLVSIADEGKSIRVLFADDIIGETPKLRQLLSLYAFLPDGKAQLPDSTHTPQLRPGQDQVIGDHIFRSPFVTAQKGSLALSVVPDIDILTRRRSMPMILELDARPDVTDATLMGFGFCNYETVGHVRYARKRAPRAVPNALRFAYTLRPSATAEPFAAFQEPVNWLWDKYARKLVQTPFPQVMSWDEYAQVCIPAAMNEKYGDNKLGWFEDENGGGIFAGWGFTEGRVNWQCWFNNLRSAWGVRYFGMRQKNAQWVERADKMLDLALSAPNDKGAFPTTYNGRTKEWIGCMMQPDKSYYYDLPSMAWKGIWLIEWLKFGKRTDDIKEQCRDLASLFVGFQNKDGSYPSWLTKDFKKGDLLLSSAQSALPGWFLARWNQIEPNKEWLDSAKKCADFLIKEVIPQQKYYDYETFFSCSPKPCLTDDEAMRDPHTLAPPQNTLCMQWSAELMRTLYEQDNQAKYAKYGRMALDMMNTYQTAWAPPFITSAYAFGGFGVQNSDGEHLDARQAQFGATDFEWGVLLQDRALCERGVAAMRAAMTLINHPLHELSNLYPQPNYPLGLQPENVAHGGEDHQNGRTGFDWGEGSGLATAAWLLDKFGPMYAAKNGDWAIGIDAVQPVKSDGKWVATSALNLMPIASRIGVSGLPAAPGLRVADTMLMAGEPRITLEVFTHGEIVAKDGSGKAVSEKVQVEPSIVCIPVKKDARRVVFELKSVDGNTYTNPFDYVLDPVWDFEKDAEGWTFSGNLPNWVTSSKRYDFGANGSRFIGTCEDGFGGFDDTLTMRAVSPVFTSSKKKVKLLVGGGAGEKTYVALLNGITGQRIYVAHGKNAEKMHEVEWDVEKYIGKPLRIEIVDRSAGAWGHINCDYIRVSGD